MIVKNICPFPKHLRSLGDKYLMPGEECDLSNFTQKERDSCVELQESFRKGEFICIGMGQQGRQARLEAARTRALNSGPAQPLIPVVSGARVTDGDEEEVQILDKPEDNRDDPRYYRSPNIQEVEPVTRAPTSIIEVNKQGMISVQPLPTPRSEPKSEPEPLQIETPTITSERIQEIMAQRCISFRSNGKKCKRWSVKGYEYCISHLPKKLSKEYKEKKKKDFFHE